MVIDQVGGLLRATGRQLQIMPMRGNIDTRLRKLAGENQRSGCQGLSPRWTAPP
jgi:hypothetical protein